MPARPHTIPQFTARAETQVERSNLNPGVLPKIKKPPSEQLQSRAPWNQLCRATSAAP